MKNQPMNAVDITRNVSGPFLPAPSRMRQVMNWFFADTERLFWLLQALGWSGFGIIHLLSVSSLVAGWSAQSIVFSVASSLVGLVCTGLLLRPAYRFARRLPPAQLLLLAVGATIPLAVLMSAVKAQTFGLIFGNDWIVSRGAALGTNNFFMLIRPDIPANLFLLMSWGGFYFGINYYLTLRSESERALRSARLADQAQLKMLRYQLNPHFLFNTLNAISTLVLEQDGRHANEMLTKLSSFLRYSLDSDPLQKTTLAEEIRALQLYLDIEATRFGNRLTVDLDIEPQTLDARVPSLILQPAIENSIKYAIARMESGGRISIISARDGAMLRLQVCDNGPDAPADPEKVLANPRAGVGLVNMRERLVHLYGDQQSFAVSRPPGEGFCVTLTMPYETRA